MDWIWGLLKLLGWLIIIPLSIALGYIIYMAIMEFISYQRLKFYSNQKIKTYYFPIYGITEFYKANLNQDDGLRRFRDMVSEHSKHELIAVNYPMKFRPMVVLLDSELTKEFFHQELNFVKRMFPFDLKLKGGFLFDYSVRGHHMRSIFSSFFSNENLEKITPSIRSIVQNHFDKFEIQRHLQMLKNFGREIDKIIIQIVNVVLFGEKDIPTIDGITVTEVLVEVICSMISERGIYNKWNIYSMDLLNILNLLPNSRKVVAAKKKIHEVILETYNRRRKQPKDKLGCNLIDLMIKHNLEAESSGRKEDILSDEEIIGCIITLQFASADTTKNLTLNTLYFLGKNVSYQHSIYHEIMRYKLNKPETGYFGLDASEYLNNFLKECLRLFGPGVQSFDREVIKDTKLGNYTLQKGTIVIVPYNANAVSTKYFENPYEFNPNRFSGDNQKKIDKMAYHPFGFGKRGCFGQYLGVMIVKLILVHLLDEYLLDFDEKDQPRPYFLVSITYGVSECYLYVQHRSPSPAPAIPMQPKLVLDGLSELLDRV
jgi:cytochrome P450